jgi:hypothetical protein
MAVAEMPKWSLRLERAESSRLGWAFVLSLALHLAVFGTYQTGKKFNVWQRLHWPAWMQSAKMLTEVLKKKDAAQLQPQPQQQVPLMFVDVNPAQVVAEAPKNAKFYSDKSSIAADKALAKVSDLPKVTGKQTEVVRIEDVSREKFVPLQPSPPVPKPQAPQEEQKPKPAYTPGDLVLAKPAPVSRKDEGKATEAKTSRPRTVKELQARQPDIRLPGEKLQQDGGVGPRMVPGFDVAASPFGAYDRALIEAISQRWYALLDEHQYASDSRGKVVLQFHLHHDGRITEMNVSENSAGEMLSLLCQRAILDPQPFPTWPADMRRLLGNTRSIQFTFYYN